MNQTINRRTLVFHSFSEVVDDVRHLLASGYRQVGRWNLAQVCNHLNEWIRFPVDGYPPVPVFLRPVFWVLSRTIMPRKLDRYLADRSFPAGKPTMAVTVFSADACTDQEAFSKLAATIERVGSYREPLHPSPLFGPLSRDKHLGLQLVHAAHHLSFLRPKDSA